MTDTAKLTLLAIILLVAFAFFSVNHQLGQNRSLTIRRMPWMALAMGALATAFVLLVHFVNLMGIETGRR